MFGLLVAVFAAAPDSIPATYSGAAGQLKVAIPRIESEIDVDGLP